MLALDTEDGVYCIPNIPYIYVCLVSSACNDLSLYFCQVQFVLARGK